MAKKLEDVFEQIQKPLAEALRRLPPILGNEVVNFAHDNFDRQSFNGVPWQKRKNPTKWGKRDDEGRSLLVKTGRLRRSIRVAEILENRVKIVAGGADVPYARAHNEGSKGMVTQYVNPFLRRGKKGKTESVNGFFRTINQNIPKRQFISGDKDSPELAYRLKKIVNEELKKAFNQAKGI